MLPLDTDLLVCPETKQKLKMADAHTVAFLNDLVTVGQLCNRSGEKINDTFSHVLVRADGKVGYLVRENIPLLLPEESISMI